MNAPTPRRSWLFTPGNHPRRVEKVFQSGADVAILDLEDAVAAEEKTAARASVVEALRRPRGWGGVGRVNGWDTAWCYGDLQAVVGPWLDGLVLPKSECAQSVRTFDWLLTQLERERELPAGALELVPLVETARGVVALEQSCAASPRGRRGAFGGGDYTLGRRLL
ncbi:MAG: HpcH/HpaI aldolase/citrate lyase family protein, partial [Pseudomonadota bacterium]